MNAPAEIKFCRDCKHCITPAPRAYDLATCSHEKSIKMSADYLVSGISEAGKFHYASSMRQGACGPEGKLWERKT